MQMILIGFVFLMTSTAFAGPKDIPHREVEALFSALICEQAADTASSFFDRQAYELSFWENCAGLSSEHRTESEVIKLLLDLTIDCSPNDRGGCTTQRLRQAGFLKYATRAGVHVNADRRHEATIRRLMPASSYATTLVVLRDRDGTQISLVFVWARMNAKWRVASVDMVCV